MYPAPHRDIRQGERVDRGHNWSERSACAARAALQTGCVANEVAIKFVLFFSLELELSEMARTLIEKSLGQPLLGEK